MGPSRGPLGLSWSPLGPFSEPSSGHPRRRWRAPGNPEKDPRGIREGPKSATKPCDESARRTRATNWSDELAPRIRPTKLSDEFLEGRGYCKLPTKTAAPTAKRKLVASGRPSSSSPEQICRPRFSSAVSNSSAKNFVVDFKFVVRQIRRRFQIRRPRISSSISNSSSVKFVVDLTFVVRRIRRPSIPALTTPADLARLCAYRMEEPATFLPWRHGTRGL